MNKDMKTFLAIIGALLIGGGSLALGAMTAPTPQAEQQKQSASEQRAPQKSEEPRKPVAETVESATIAVLNELKARYPKTADYAMHGARLYKDGAWFGATLTYQGADTMNRDTLRVLAQKKDGRWILRTTPPEQLLSSNKYGDAPNDVLKSINAPVSLPGTDS